eukprot:136186-Rhodomonas_salina.1
MEGAGDVQMQDAAMGLEGTQGSESPSEPITAPDGAVWRGVDTAKARETFEHYDVERTGKLETVDVVDLSVDLHQAFNPDKTLSEEQVASIHDELLERLESDHGRRDGTISFKEFLPWYAQNAFKHWRRMHGVKHESDEAGQSGS